MGISIEVSNLKKFYGSLRALESLTLRVDSTVRRLGVLGRNGAGKTTFLRILVDLLEADSGSVCVNYEGATYSCVGPVLGTYLAETVSLLPTLRGKALLSLYAEINSSLGVQTDLALREELISQLGLSEHLEKYSGRMSKGTQRKLQVVAALSAQTPLFIADELTEGLDAPSRLILQEVILRLASQRQFIISSHDIGFISSVADHVAVIDHGRLVDVFNTQDVDVEVFQDRIRNSFQLIAPDMTRSDSEAR